MVDEMCRICRGQIRECDSWPSGVAASILILPGEAIAMGRYRRFRHRSMLIGDLIEKWCYGKILSQACVMQILHCKEASDVQTGIGGSDLHPGLW